MTKSPKIIDIGGVDKKRFGYCIQTKEVYSKESSDRGLNIIFSVVALGPIIGNILYEKYFSLKVVPSNQILVLLIYPLIIISIFIFVILISTFFIKEKYSNWKKFGKVADLADLTFEQVSLIKETKRENNFIISVCTFSLLIGICAIPIVIHYLLETKESVFALLYVLSIILINIGIYGYFYYYRCNKVRRYILGIK